MTHKIGWVLFERTYRPPDRVFDPCAGPASKQVQEILDTEVIKMIEQYDKRSAQMTAFMLAQKKLGYIGADELFLRACVEGIRMHLPKFLYFTFVRICAHLGLVDAQGLSHKEFASETDTGHMWGFSHERTLEEAKGFEQVMNTGICSLKPSPLAWERCAIFNRILSLAGLRIQAPAPGHWAEFRQILFFNPDGSLCEAGRSDGNMSERMWTCRDLDRYFYFCFWGKKGYNKNALLFLRMWNILIPTGEARRYINIAFLLFWAIAVFFSSQHWQRVCLGGLLLYYATAAVVQCVFSDNFGGRFALYTKAYLWLGGLCGIHVVLRIIRGVYCGKARPIC